MEKMKSIIRQSVRHWAEKRKAMNENKTTESLTININCLTNFPNDSLSTDNQAEPYLSSDQHEMTESTVAGRLKCIEEEKQHESFHLHEQRNTDYRLSPSTVNLLSYMILVLIINAFDTRTYARKNLIRNGSEYITQYRNRKPSFQRSRPYPLPCNSISVKSIIQTSIQILPT